ncbi:MAG TPA: hypothetical protein VJZ49_11895 [Syntrophales bacterium]|nr:hypothetical protein [Syntrophales bacterium]
MMKICQNCFHDFEDVPDANPAEVLGEILWVASILALAMQDSGQPAGRNYGLLTSFVSVHSSFLQTAEKMIIAMPMFRHRTCIFTKESCHKKASPSVNDFNK